MTLLKSIVYRMFASAITILIAYIMTGNLILSSGIGLFEFISKIFAYYVFEKIWNKVAEFANLKSYRRECFKFNKTGMAILISGLNCTGKTTLAKALAKVIPNTVLLDGDAVRNSINYDLGFSDNDIHTNLTKVANLTNLLNDQGYNVIISCISKKKNDRAFMKETIKSNDFYEICMTCDEYTLKNRQKKLHPDTKVIQVKYEHSDYSVIKLDSGSMSVDECVEEVLCQIQKD